MESGEKFEDHGAHPVEVSGAGGATEPSGKKRLAHLYGVIGRIEFFRVGSEDDIGTEVPAEGQIAFKGARVACEVGWAVELKRVDEDGDKDRPSCSRYFAGGPDEGCVSVMQRSHGGDEDGGFFGLRWRRGERREVLHDRGFL